MNSQQHNVKRQPTKGKLRQLTPDLYCDSMSNQAAWGAGACLPPCPQVDYSPYITMCREEKQRRQWHPTPELLPGKSHGRRSLEGCSPWDRWGSDTTERLHLRCSLSCIGEGNGNPSSVLAWESQGRGSLGCRLWGRTELDMTEVT